MTRRSRAWSTLLAASLIGGLHAACDSPYELVNPETGLPILPPPLGIPTPGPAGPSVPGHVAAALRIASGCDDLADALKAQAIAEITAATQTAFEYAWRRHEECEELRRRCANDAGPACWSGPRGDMGPVYANGGMSPDPPVALEDHANAGAPSPAHSETNTQIAGVDEPDIAKTDGERIYLVGTGSLRMVKAWPAPETRILATVPLEGTPKKLFVLGDRLLLYSAASLPTREGDASRPPASECTYGYDCVPTGDGYPTRIEILDIRDPSSPKVVRRIDLSGSLLAARRIGSAVHTVVTETNGSALTANLATHVFDLDPCEVSRPQIYRAYRDLLHRNVKQIVAAPVSTLFPTGHDSQDGRDLFGECAGFYRTAANAGSQFTSIVSLALDSAAPAQTVTILSDPGFVSASAQALYVAVPTRPELGGWDGQGNGVGETTVIHKFRLPRADVAQGPLAAAAYAASGSITGRILNQFALDEQNDLVRVASTNGHVTSGSDEGVHSTVTVLAQRGEVLETVGLLDGLAPREDIRSVRFDGDQAYVVTFKKTDPLFVIDLADPTAPKVLGELKIPGFSTYMQKLDQTHLLTIGYDADDQGSFAWFAGVLLQIFDLSDPTAPTLKFKHLIGTRGSSSEALTNHLAFTYYAPKNVLTLPITVCGGGTGGSYGTELTFSGMMVFDVTAATGFAPRGKVEHPLVNGRGCGNWWTSASSQVKRSLIIDRFVYSLSDERLKVNDLDALGPDVATLPLAPFPTR